MNLEEFSYLAAMSAGAATGFVTRMVATGPAESLGALVLGVLLGWISCFVPFFLSRLAENAFSGKISAAFFFLGVAGPLLTTATMLMTMAGGA
ncbi:hypothetical protein [Roseibacillus ishigakijimensis]|uniref:Uncharacterized protein n=1 Tax=Roseibacillus ishigakijimensis TaxID=454146 RepID=A0A934VLJ4_9BACT|nr:hypothetical protein [Roseibacillus ishigakijimensis]MBK1832955.1 hypothetical protein [Roseibacillus ishigakijimensis]